MLRIVVTECDHNSFDVESAVARAIGIERVIAQSRNVDLAAFATYRANPPQDRCSSVGADALVANTSRGGVIDTDALVEALRSRTILGAAIDVHEQEPLALDHPPTMFDSVVFTPHLAWYTEESYWELTRAGSCFRSITCPGERGSGRSCHHRAEPLAARRDDRAWTHCRARRRHGRRDDRAANRWRGRRLTFNSAAHSSVAAELAATTRVHGRTVIEGVYKEPTAVDLQAICFQEQSVVGVRIYTSTDIVRAIELMAAYALNLSSFPSRSFDLAKPVAVFAAVERGQESLKVMITHLYGKANREHF